MTYSVYKYLYTLSSTLILMSKKLDYRWNKPGGYRTLGRLTFEMAIRRKEKNGKNKEANQDKPL